MNTQTIPNLRTPALPSIVASVPSGRTGDERAADSSAIACRPEELWLRPKELIQRRFTDLNPLKIVTFLKKKTVDKISAQGE